MLNWGFPARELLTVRALADAGVSLWWFDGDRAVARKVYEERAKQQLARQVGKSPVEQARDLQDKMFKFDNQYYGLSQNKAKIEPLFSGHVITTLRPDGTFMENEEIFSLMGL